MELKNILFEVSDQMALITVNRPEVRNALDLQTVNELHAVIRAVSDSDRIGAAILTGIGDKVFVSGADIRDIRARNKMDALRGINSRLFKAVEDCAKPLIAAINGYALGGGFELALSCDIRICTENAKFGLPEVSLGIIPGAGGLYRLFRISGLGVAKELILTGDTIDAQRASQCGIVSQIVPKEKLLITAQDICKKILSRGPLAVRLAKRSLNLVPQLTTEAAMALDEYAQGILFESEDKLEGTSAFLEKRPPKFKGN
jgi:enoyl-CoA hydratase